MNSIFRYTFLASLIGCLVIISSCEINQEWNKYYDTSSLKLRENVLDLIKGNSNYSKFYEKIIATGYDSILNKNQYFTVFVPTNDAFASIPEYTNTEWKQIVGFHICYSSLFSKDFGNIDVLSSIGKYLKIKKINADSVKIFESNINMNKVDNNCKNGTIHEIDKILIPKKNTYEYIMSLGSEFSLIKKYLNSMDQVYIDLDKSTRIGVDDQGNTIYDTVWSKKNYFLDNIALLNNEKSDYTTFIIKDEDVLKSINNASQYFGNVNDLDEKTFLQLLSIVFSASFYNGIYMQGSLPDTLVSVVGKAVSVNDLHFSGNVNLDMSNGMLDILDGLNIPKEFFLYPIVIECDQKDGRKVSNTVYSIEVRSDSRATNGTYFKYGSKFIGDYVEYSIDMVLATSYVIVWTSPALGGSLYQLSIDGVNLGDPVDNYYKGNFKLVVAGTYSFDKFGTKTIRMTVVGQSIPGYNSIYLDYIKLIPQELYNP